MATDLEFMKTVQAAFGPELASGTLHIVSHSYSEESFGNADAILACPEFRLCLSRNRSELFAELAHPKFPEEWYALQLVVRAFRGEEETEHNYAIDFEAAANLLRADHELLTQRFSKGWWRLKRARLRRLKEENTTRVIKWLQSPEGKKQSAETKARIEEVRRRRNLKQ